jgi:hypothetical protein
MFDEILLFTIYTEFLRLNNKKTKNPIQKRTKDPNSHLSKEDVQMASRLKEICLTSYVTWDFLTHTNQNDQYPKH